MHIRKNLRRQLFEDGRFWTQADPDSWLGRIILMVEDDGKLGHGFTSADVLEKVDIGPGIRPRPTFISAKIDPKYKQGLIKLLKEFKDCFA